jgi:hypothetical protein
MDIALVLLAASALIGAAAGLRLKALALVPVASLIAVFSAAALHMNGFGPRSGIVIIIGCLILNQAAYLLVQVLCSGLASDPSSDNVTDGEPSAGRQQAIEDDHSGQKPAPTLPPENERPKRHLP